MMKASQTAENSQAIQTLIDALKAAGLAPVQPGELEIQAQVTLTSEIR